MRSERCECLASSAHTQVAPWHELTMKYVSHPGRNLSSSIRSRVSRYFHKPSVVGKQLSTFTVASDMTLEKSVIALVEFDVDVEDEDEGVEGP